MLKYKGYLGSAEFSAEDEVLHGQIVAINDLVTYEGDSVKALKKAFEEVRTEVSNLNSFVTGK